MTGQPSFTDDTGHLRLLSIFHYIVGGLALLFACFPLIHVTIGSILIFAAAHAHSPSGEAPPEIVGWIFLFFGLALFALGLAFGIALLWSGRCLALRKQYWFSFVMACIQCLFFPFGTGLGVCTLIVLSRDSVKALFFPNSVAPPMPAES
jgi:hypothetical protein